MPFMTLRLRNYRKGFFNALRIPQRPQKIRVFYDDSNPSSLVTFRSNIYTADVPKITEMWWCDSTFIEKSFKNSTRIGIVKAKGK